MKNLYKLFLPAIIIISTLNLPAQSWGFAQTGHWVQDVAVAADGNIWAVGYGGDDPDWLDVTANYVLKLNSDGEKLWGETPAGLPWTIATANSIMPTADGGAVVYCTNDVAMASLYKLDADGNLLWETSGMWAGPAYTYGGAACQLNDGRFIIGGLITGAFFFTVENIFYEIDADGNFLSTFSSYPDTTGFAWSYWEYKECGITSTSDGGFAYASGNGHSKTLAKYNADLSLAWNNNYEWITDWEYGYWNSIKTTSDGGFLLAGSGYTTGGFYSGTLRKIDGDGNLEWANLYNHGYENEEGGWAIENGADHYTLWTQDGGDVSSAGWVTDLSGMETGSIEIPIINCNWGLTETGLEVWDAENTADGGQIIAGRQWLEDCDHRLTIIKSNPDGSFDPCIFNCVWPGDANNDAVANMDDLFEIGINYGATGFSRDDMGIDWSAKLSRAWMEADSLWYILSDLKWTDCNGDGTINDDDTMAVSNNFGLEHPLNNLKTEEGDVPLYFAPEDPVLHIGLNQIPIVLGDDINPVDEIYGLSFTIELTGTENVDVNSLKVNFNDSWLSTADTRLSISKTNTDEYLVFAGVVRKDRANVGGSGEIGTLSIVVIDNITGKTEAEEATLNFLEAKAIKLNRDEISIETGSVTFPVEESESIISGSQAAITIYPNPTSGTLYFENLDGKIIEEITVTDITGKIIISSTDHKTNSIDLSLLESGSYFIKFRCADEMIVQKFTMQ